MSDTSLDFALTAYNNIKNRLISGRGKNHSASLIVIGEQHGNNDPDKPAVNAAFAEIAALEAASHIVSKNKVILSVELPQNILDMVKQKIRDNHGEVPQNWSDRPSVITIAYAMKHGFSINASDPQALNPQYQSADNTSEPRENEMRQCVTRLARNFDGIVVHIGGVSHISNFSGYSNEEITKSNGSIIRDPKRNPFNGVYSPVLLINANDPSRIAISEMSEQANQPTQRGLSAKNALAELNYSTNPKNALQIYPDKKLNPVVEIGSYVREAVLNAEKKLSKSEYKELSNLSARRQAMSENMSELMSCMRDPKNTDNFCLDQFRVRSGQHTRN